jgi:hypothetical protein
MYIVTKLNEKESEFPCRGTAVDALQNVAVVSITAYCALL